MKNQPNPVFEANARDLETRLRWLATNARHKTAVARNDAERTYLGAASKWLATLAGNLDALRAELIAPVATGPA